MLFYFEKYVKQFLQRIIKTKKESIYVRYVLSSIVSCRLMLFCVIASNLQTLTRDEKRKSRTFTRVFEAPGRTSSAFHARMLRTLYSTQRPEYTM